MREGERKGVERRKGEKEKTRGEEKKKGGGEAYLGGVTTQITTRSLRTVAFYRVHTAHCKI